ncbi:hypothetical protein CFOL_v3_29438 [Cephalotus follicularis]|uniref:Transmembrane protein n=1 Tax=Cephalotus follicularis TaxID=3775 RepID=A0A1Q3D0M8_CEPFO|nr:hypothetical protein CFOL_v3_29438 [Cephalotus follicularis]
MANHYHSSPYYSQPPLPIHLCFFLVVLFMLVGLTWYIKHLSFLEGVLDQVKMVLMISPLLLLLLVHCLSSHESRRFLSLPQRNSLHGAGGTPWGVGCLLVLLFFMISYQSYFKELCFLL